MSVRNEAAYWEDYYWWSISAYNKPSHALGLLKAKSTTVQMSLSLS